MARSAISKIFREALLLLLIACFALSGIVAAKARIGQEKRVADYGLSSLCLADSEPRDGLPTPSQHSSDCDTCINGSAPSLLAVEVVSLAELDWCRQSETLLVLAGLTFSPSPHLPPSQGPPQVV